jgi:pyrroloquinoline-quinone synthase
MMSIDQFREALQQVGGGKYHHLHRFHQRMNAGELSPQAIRTWVTSRFFYQKAFRLKMPLFLATARYAKCGESGCIA